MSARMPFIAVIITWAGLAEIGVYKLTSTVKLHGIIVD